MNKYKLLTCSSSENTQSTKPVKLPNNKEDILRHSPHRRSYPQVHQSPKKVREWRSDCSGPLVGVAESVVRGPRGC